MAQQFLFSYMHNTYKHQQILPDVFDEYFYNENQMLYITGNDRLRYKVEIKRKHHRWVLHDSHWVDFVKSNVPASSNTIHFIKQGDNDYHVTVYNNDGSECFGYERREVGKKMTRCLCEYNPNMQILPGEFLQDIWVNKFRIHIDNLRFWVKHKRVQQDQHSRKRDNAFYGYGWTELCNTVGLEIGQRLVFSNLDENRVSMVVIGSDGLGLNREVIYPTLLRRPGRAIQYRDIKDKRLSHICTWPMHNTHATEDDVFYTSLCAYVTDGYKLTIPAAFCTTHAMHTKRKAYVVHQHVRFPMMIERVVHQLDPSRTNHVVMKGNWRGFGLVCGFGLPKMMRLKLVGVENEIVEGEVEEVVNFHAC